MLGRRDAYPTYYCILSAKPRTIQLKSGSAPASGAANGALAVGVPARLPLNPLT